uniref:hypothetical protein n=1 Tax=Fulvivirga sp. TaxID=1931237 RepID=UPI00404AB031
MKNAISIMLLMITFQSFGQWTGTGTTTTTPATEVIINSGKQPTATIWFTPTNLGPASPGNYYIKAYDYWGSTLHFQGTGDGGNERMNVTVDGNMGIGTDNPQTTLHLNSPSSSIIRMTRSGANIFGYEIGQSTFGLYDHTNGQYKWRTKDGNVFLVETSGNVGIGTINPMSKFHIRNGVSGAWAHSFSDLTVEDDDHVMVQLSTPNNKVGYYGFGDSDDDFVGGLQYNHLEDEMTLRVNNYTSSMVINSANNIGIGTTNPTHKLDVNGTIHASEVLVDLNVEGPDFVFEEDYPLSSLSEIESYIKANKHLPEVPSAVQMKEEGVNVVEMQMLLLKKVEELTLLLIKESNENKELGKKLNQVEAELKDFKSKL